MLNVLQLTDTHLFADPGQDLYGVRTQQSLQAVIDDVRRRALNYDVVLVTGDLVHDEGEEAYAILQQMIAQLDAPAHYLPGNHDSASLLNQCIEHSPVAGGLHAFMMDKWLVVMLDSSIPGEVEGLVTASALTKLDELLLDHQQEYTLIAVHHQPVKTGSAWMDRIGLSNGDALLDVLDRHEQVRLVINGHIHQDLSVDVGHVRVLGTPSTCAQFKPHMETAVIDDAPPGYRYLQLRDDGSFVSWVFSL